MASAGGGAFSKPFLVEVRRSLPCPRLASPILPWEMHTSHCHLPRLLATLTTNAARLLLAVVPGGTGTIGAAAWAIETVSTARLRCVDGSSLLSPDACRMGPGYCELVRATMRDHV